MAHLPSSQRVHLPPFSAFRTQRRRRSAHSLAEGDTAAPPPHALTPLPSLPHPHRPAAGAAATTPGGKVRGMAEGEAGARALCAPALCVKISAGRLSLSRPTTFPPSSHRPGNPTPSPCGRSPSSSCMTCVVVGGVGEKRPSVAPRSRRRPILFSSARHSPPSPPPPQQATTRQPATDDELVVDGAPIQSVSVVGELVDGENGRGGGVCPPSAWVALLEKIKQTAVRRPTRSPSLTPPAPPLLSAPAHSSLPGHPRRQGRLRHRARRLHGDLPVRRHGHRPRQALARRERGRQAAK